MPPLAGHEYCPRCLMRIDAAIDRAVQNAELDEVEPLSDDEDTQPGAVVIPVPERIRTPHSPLWLLGTDYAPDAD